MKKRLISMGVLAAAVLTMLTGCGGNNAASGSADNGDKITIRLGGEHAPTSSLTRCWEEVFIPRVSELTNGRVEVEFFPNGVLGGNSEMLEQTQQGKTLQMMYVSDASSTISPDKLNVISLPFLFKNEEHFDAVIDGEYGEWITSDLPKAGLHPLGFLENGFRELTNDVRPINSLADLKGLKIRVTNSEVMINLFQSLGANTVVMDYSEVYSGLSTGVIEGQENGYNMIVNGAFYDVQKYVAETNHVMGYFVMVANDEWFQGLPEDIQQAIAQAAAETSEYQRKLHRESLESDKKICTDHGMAVTTPDLTEFQEAAQPVYDKFLANYPESEETVRGIQELGKQYE